MEQKDPEKLFEKYRAGTLTQDEMVLLESWYLQLSKDKNVEIKSGDLPNVDAFWERLAEDNEHRSFRQPHSASTISWPRWLAAASVAIICAFAGLYYFKGTNIFSDGRTSLTIRHQTANQEMKQVLLPDGTRVWLNAGSNLDHPKEFDDDSRNIVLQGEAYFEVAHDPERPFIITSGDFQTRVLGTSFNVSAYPEDLNFEVAVLTGKVSVSSVPGQQNGPQEFSALLTATQHLRYNYLSKDLRSYKDPDIKDVVAWRQGRLIYRNTPLSEVIPDLERKYSIRLTANREILRCGIFLELNNEPLKKVLKVLAALVDGKVTKSGSAYHLTGKPCKAR